MDPVLTTLYNNNFKASLEILEKKRKNIIVSSLLEVIVTALVITSIYFILPSYKIVVSSILVLVAFRILRKRIKGKVSEFNLKYKQSVVQPISELMQGDLSYEPTVGIPQDVFETINLVKGNYDHYTSSDLFIGSIGETHFEFAEVCIKENQSTDSTLFKTKLKLFEGLVFIANFNKSTTGKTIICPDIFGGKYGKLAALAMKEIFPTSGLERVKLEDPLFESHFEVFGSDQVETRYIISTSLMERLLTMRSKGFHIGASFEENNLYLLVFLNRKLFNASVFRSVKNEDKLISIIENLTFMTDVVSTLNLNNRIYTT